MTNVQVLTRGGWSDVGDYRPDRAEQIVNELRESGRVVRMDGEVPDRSRVCWSAEIASDTWLGKIDDITLFVMTPLAKNRKDPTGKSWLWALYVLLPGYQDKVYQLDGQIEAEDTADQILDRFLIRLGYRGLFPGVPRVVTEDQVPTTILPRVGMTNTTLALPVVPGSDSP